MPIPNANEKTSPVQVERRRSQRVLLVIPVELSWTKKDGAVVKEAAETEVVNAHGALLRVKNRILFSSIPKEIEITHRLTRKSTRARVVGTGSPAPDGLMRIAVELSVPSGTFWGVTLPALPTEAPLPSRPARPAPSR